MTVLAQALSRLTRTDIDVESLEAISIFCGIGLLLTLIGIKAYGLDLTAAFFLIPGMRKPAGALRSAGNRRQVFVR